MSLGNSGSSSGGEGLGILILGGGALILGGGLIAGRALTGSWGNSAKLVTAAAAAYYLKVKWNQYRLVESARQRQGTPPAATPAIVAPLVASPISIKSALAGFAEMQYR